MNPFRDIRGQSITELYSDWSWLVPQTDLTEPILMTFFGDLVYLKPDGTVWLLDVIRGTNSQLANDIPSLQTLITDHKVQESLYLVSLAQKATDKGLLLAPNEIYSFIIPPSLNGALKVKNIAVSDVSVALSLAGQIHQQTQGLAPGTKISGMKVSKPLKPRL